MSCAFKQVGDCVSAWLFQGRVCTCLKEGAEEYFAKGEHKTGKRLAEANVTKKWFYHNMKRVLDMAEDQQNEAGQDIAQSGIPDCNNNQIYAPFSMV